MSRTQNRLAFAISSAIMLMLICLIVGALAPASAFGEEVQLAATTTQADDTPFTVEDTDYGINDPSITGKRIVLADGVKALNYERYYSNKYGRIENRGDGYLLLSKKNGSNWRFYLVNKNAEVVKTYETDDEEDVPLLSLISCDYRNGDGSNDGFVYRDTLYTVLSPEDELYDVFNATRGEFYELGTTEIKTPSSYDFDWPMWGLTYKLNGSWGILAFDGTRLSDPEYSRISLIGRLDNGVLVYKAVQGSSNYVIPSDGSWKAGPFRWCGEGIENDDDPSVLEPFLEVGVSDGSGILALDEGRLLTNKGYEDLVYGGKGAFIGDEKDLITDQGVTDLTVLFSDLDHVEASAYGIEDGHFWVEGREPCSYYVEDDGWYDSYVTVVNLIDKRGEVLGSKTESIESGTGVHADRNVATFGNFTLREKPVKSSWTEDSWGGWYYADYDVELKCLDPDARYRDEAESLDLCSNRELDDLFGEDVESQIMTAYDKRYVFCYCADGTVALVDTASGKVVCEGLSGERFEHGGRAVEPGYMGSNVDIIYEGEWGNSKFGLINTVTSEFSGFVFEGDVHRVNSYSEIGGRASADQAWWLVDGKLIDESFNVVHEFSYDKEEMWGDAGLSIDVGSDFTCVVKDFTRPSDEDNGDDAESNSYSPTVYIFDMDGAEISMSAEFFNETTEFSYDHGLGYSFRMCDEQTDLMGLVGRDGKQLTDSSYACIGAEHHYVRYVEEPDADEEEFWDDYVYLSQRDRSCGLLGRDGSWLVYGDYRVPAEWGRGQSCRPYGQTLVLQEAEDWDDKVFYLYDFSQYVQERAGGQPSSGEVHQKGGYVYASIRSKINIPSAMVDYSIYKTLHAEVNAQNLNNKYYWEDKWLNQDSTQFNRKLAIAAMNIAWSAYDQKMRSGAKKYITKTLKNLGMKDIDISSYSDRVTNDDYDYTYEHDYVAYAFGHRKTLDENGEPVEIVIVAVRGTPGNIEWNSNGNIADSTNGTQLYEGKFHEAFKKAEEELIQRLGAYFSRNGLDSSTAKILICGHSRGAAVANLLAADLQEQTTNPYVHDFTKDRVYAYTFATPAVAVDQDAHSDAYDNIFNIVNPEDFVPRLPLKAWGFERYGTTYYLPSKSTEPDKYKRYYNEFASKFRRFDAEPHPYANGTADVDSAMQTAAKISPTVQRFYADKHVNVLSYIRLCRGDLNGAYYSLMTFREFFGNLMAFLGEEWINGAVMDAAYTGTPMGKVFWFFASHGVNLTDITGLHDDCFAHGHTMETYLCWLETLDEANEDLVKYGDSIKATKLIMYCPINVYVHDAEGNVVSQIVRNKETYFGDEATNVPVSYDALTDAKTVWLPKEGGYYVTVEPYEQGTLDIVCTNQGFEGEEGVYAAFNDLRLDDDGSIYTITPLAADEGAPVEDSVRVENADGSVVAANYVVEPAETGETFSVVVAASEGGTALGVEGAFRGEHVTAYAEPNEGYEFDCWLEDGNMVEGAGATYTFRIEGNRTLVARFLPVAASRIDMAESLSLVVGQTKELYATVYPENALNQDIEYSSSNPAVIEVDADGYVTAKSSGSAVVIAKVRAIPGVEDWVEAKCQVTCTKPSVTPSEKKKLANPMTAKTKLVKVKRGKKATLSAKKAFVVKNAKGTISYKVAKYDKKAKKKITVSKKGMVTVKKGLKKGLYKLKVTIIDAGTSTYLKKSLTVTLKVRVR